jgi:enoyl-CoA hydratase/carnithine racemase
MHWFCFGAGLELPLCCDLRLASEDATFALPEVSLGYIPSAGATQTLPRLIPPGIAAGMIISGEPIGSKDALGWGLVDEVHAEEELDGAIGRAVENALGEPRPVRARRERMLQANGLALPA